MHGQLLGAAVVNVHRPACAGDDERVYDTLVYVGCIASIRFVDYFGNVA